MRILATGDTHLNDKPRDGYRHEFMRKLPALVERHHIQHVVLLGDLTDEKDRHPAWLVNKVVEYIEDLRGRCWITIVRGNHDALDLANPFFAFLQSISHVTWINEPTEIGEVLYLPHTHDHARDWHGLDFARYKLIFTHNTFAGANIGARMLDGIPTDVFPPGVRVISGDIHAPQTVGPVTYAGAPYLVDFGDDYEPRMLILDAATGKLTSLRCSGPQKRLLEIEVQHLKTLPLESAKEFNAGDILKVRLWMTPAESTQWFEFKQVIHGWAKERDLVIHAVQFMVTAPGTEGREIVHTEHRKSDDEMLQEYATARGLDEPTVTAGLNLMRQA